MAMKPVRRRKVLGGITAAGARLHGRHLRRAIGLGVALLLMITVGDVAAAQERDEAAPVPLALAQIEAGNVFIQGDQVEFGVATTGDVLEWRVHDYWGAEVATGRTAVNESTDRLQLPMKELGYFTLDMTVEAAGAVLGETATSFTILEPFDFDVHQDAVRFGMNTHLDRWSGRAQLIGLMKNAGVQTIRDGMTWNVVEPNPGEYNWTRISPIMQDIRESGLQPLIILGLTNRNYAGGCMPWTANSQQAFAAYAQAVKNRFPWVPWYEVYNEWNINFGNPAGCADFSAASRYGPLLGATHNRLPAGSVVGGVTSWIPVGWFGDLFATGALGSLDKVSVHPYLTGPPSEPQVGTRLSQLRTLMADHGGVKPVWISEQGWSTCNNESICVSAQTQAEYIVQAHNRAFGPLGIAKYYWYDFMDNGTDPAKWDHGVGIIKNDRSPKPAYTSYSNMTRQLTGAEFVRTEQLGDGIHSTVYVRDGVEKRVIWSEQPRTLAVDAAAPVKVTNMMGGAQSHAQGALTSLRISSEPIYVTGDGVNLSMVEESTPARIAR